MKKSCFSQLFFFLLYSDLKPISHAPDRLDVLGFGGVFLDLLADLLDMYGDGGDISDGLHIPDLPEELFLRKYMVRIFRKEG